MSIQLVHHMEECMLQIVMRYGPIVSLPLPAVPHVFDVQATGLKLQLSLHLTLPVPHNPGTRHPGTCQAL